MQGAPNSDVDLGTTTFTATAADIVNPTATATGNASATVIVDAVLDQVGNVSGGSVFGFENAAPQLISLGTSMNVTSSGWNNNVADGSETISVTLQLDAAPARRREPDHSLRHTQR